MVTVVGQYYITGINHTPQHLSLFVNQFRIEIVVKLCVITLALPCHDDNFCHLTALGPLVLVDGQVLFGFKLNEAFE